MAFTSRCKIFHRLYPYLKSHQRFCSGEKKGLVLGVYSKGEEKGVELTPSAAKYNEQCGGKLLKQIELTGNEVKAGKSFVFWGLDDKFQSVAVVGLGDKNPENDELELICQDKENVRTASAVGCNALNALGVKNIEVEDFCDAESSAEGALLSTWTFQEYKTKKDAIPSVKLHSGSNDGFKIGTIKAEAQNLARKLADTPANLLTPTIFAEQVLNIFSSKDCLDIKVHDQKWAENQKMYSFLSVAKGSIEAPKFLEISYSRNSNGKKPFCLVGKGVTFDAGGISIKPSANMDHMRADMGGAASVIGALYGLVNLEVEANLKILVPLVENLPSGSAVKPGDVVIAKNGKSICVDNTDAEGRLILADALCYSAEFNPEWVLDIATLTGAMVVAVGNAATGVFSNSDKLYKSLEESGSVSGDRVWRFPLWKHYTKQIAENAAYDLNNIGKGKGGGSCTAAAFLREFAPEKTPWMHLDIASVMGPDHTVPYLSKGMTGRPTRTLIEFVRGQCK